MAILRVLFVSVLVAGVFTAPAQAVDCDSFKSLKRQVACWRSAAQVVAPAVQVAGPAGERGPVGSAGRDGVSVTGPKGDRGEAGIAGVAGAAGVAGERGASGATGATGAAGRDGVGFSSGVIFLVNGSCPVGTTMQGSENRWTVYANDTSGRPWTTTGSSAQLFLSACQVN